MADSVLHHRSNRPPTSHELAVIQDMIKKDQTCLKLLEENEEYYKVALQETRDFIEAQKEVLTNARLRHVVSIQLRDTLQKSIDSILSVGKGVAQERIPTTMSERSKVQFQTLLNLLQNRLRLAEQLESELASTEVEVRNAFEFATIAEEELEGALALEPIARESLDKCDTQIKAIKNSLQIKLDRLGTIWRVPEDIWIIIFEILTCGNFNTRSPWAWMRAISKRGPWYQQIRLLAVCRRWRSLIHHTPSLWRHALIPFTQSNQGLNWLFRQYLAVGGGRFRCITIGSPAKEALSEEEITISLSEVRSVDTIRCNLTKISGATLERWLSAMPSIRNLVLSDFGVRGNTITLSGHLCSSLERCELASIWCTFAQSTPLLKQLVISYSSSGPHTRKINASQLHQLLKRHGSTLRALELVGKVDEDGFVVNFAQDALDNLREVGATFDTIGTTLGRYYTLPSLQKLKVVASTENSIDGWEHFLVNRGCATRIEEVSLPSMSVEETLATIPFLNHLAKVKILELHGDSVEPFLQARTDALASREDDTPITLSCLAHLERLDIHSYGRSGEVVLEFIESARSNYFRDSTNRSEGLTGVKQGRSLRQWGLLQINFIDCLRISSDIRRRIAAALRL